MKFTITIFAILITAICPTIASEEYFGNYEFVPIAGTPHDVVYDANRNLAYVSNRSLNRIDLIDLNTLSVIDHIVTGSKPMGMAITPDVDNLLVTIYDDEEIAVLDLITKTIIDAINLPVGLDRNDPLRVEFDSEGTCIWRDGSGSNPYGYGYFLDVQAGASTQIFPTESDIRFNPSADKSNFIFIFDGGSACIWDASTQSFSPITSLSSYGFGLGHTNWPDAETINNKGNTILINQAGKKIWVFDEYFISNGTIDIGMGWGTFGSWDSYAIFTQRTQTQSSNKIHLLDTRNIEIVDTIELSENIGNVDDYDCGSKPIDITPDGTKLLAVGQSGLFIINTSNITEEEPVSLEIEGSTEIIENTTVTYKAIGNTPSGRTRNLTNSVIWSVEPASAGTITNGVLVTSDVENEIPVIIKAEYIGEEVELETKHNAIIFAICSYGSALSFDGVNDYVRVPRSSSIEPDEFTIELWAKLDGLQTRNTRLVRKAGHFGDGYLFAADDSGDKRIQIRVDGQGNTYAEDTITNDYYSGQWHHFAGTYSQSEVYLYIDGAEISTTNHTLGAAIYDLADLFIGSGKPSSDSSEFFKGLIDEVRIWDYPRTQEEIISTLHTRLGGTESGLVGYWDFDEGSGQIVYDLSGNGNDGFLGDDPCNVDSADPQWIESDAPIGICSSYLIAKRSLDTTLLAKKAILESLLDLPEKERAAIAALDQMLEEEDFGIVNQDDILEAKEKIEAAIQMEWISSIFISRSITKLENALLKLTPGSGDEIINEYEMYANFDYIFNSLVNGEPNADINGDGKVDFEDLAILCNQWLNGTEQ